MKFAELIPQIFFDAIARVAAGLILLASIIALWSAELDPLLKEFVRAFEAAPTTISMATLIFAYVLAFGFEGIRDELKRRRESVARLKIVRRTVTRLKIVRRIVTRLKIVRRIFVKIGRAPRAGKPRQTQWTEAWKDFSKVFPNQSMVEPKRPSDAVAIDVLRVLNPAVGARIVKLRAEVALCRTLSAGGTVLILGLVIQVLVGVAFLDAPSKPVATSLLFIILVAFVARMFGNRQRSLDDRHLRALFNHWLLLVCPGVPGMSDSPAAAECNSTEGPTTC